jgi:dTMP kinase
MKQLKRGILIAIEGIDVSGKSTLSLNLAEKLKSQGFPIRLTKEPGDTPLGAHLRTILHDKNISKTSKAEYLLFAADRAQHMNTVVFPTLKQGHIVISDRLGDSSVVYQGFARGLDINMIKLINEWAMEQHEPDLILCVHVSAHIACQRILDRNIPLTSFEQEPSAFFQKLEQGFDTLIKTKKNAHFIDGTQQPEKVTEQALEIVQSWICNNNLLL